jgi:hypothetical protein
LRYRERTVGASLVANSLANFVVNRYTAAEGCLQSTHPFTRILHRQRVIFPLLRKTIRHPVHVCDQPWAGV